MSDRMVTCLSCHVAFKDHIVQRQHYKSEWHRYNLKRKECDLPPLPYDKFQKRALAEQSKLDEIQEHVACTACKKSFNTQNQYENHVLSKKHKEKALILSNKLTASSEDEPMEQAKEGVASTESTKQLKNNKENNKTENDMEVDSDVESVDSDEWTEDNPVDSNNCIFCNHHSRGLMKNLKHMTVAHSFFIPHVEYCTDVKGLLSYLGEKVSAGYTCLWCKNKTFDSLDAVRSHMLDKNHTKMLFEGETLMEYTDFYDFSTSHPDATNPLDVAEIPEMDGSEHQLVLPSGSVIGHRSLMRYYKQSSDPNRALAIPQNEKLRNIMSMYRSLGWTETQKEAAKQKAADIKFIQRAQQKYAMKLGVKANKLQTHFRAQIMQ